MRPDCFGTNPSLQSIAENDCFACPVNRACNEESARILRRDGGTPASLTVKKILDNTEVVDFVTANDLEKVCTGRATTDEVVLSSLLQRSLKMTNEHLYRARGYAVLLAVSASLNVVLALLAIVLGVT